MGVRGYRPKGADGPMYAPERDIAYITPTLMRAAIDMLDVSNRAPDTQEWIELCGIEESELDAAIVRFAEAQQYYVSNSNPVNSITEALQRTKFFEIRPAVRMVLLASIGEALSGAWFTAVRDVTNINEDAPVQREMVEFAEAAYNFSVRGKPVIPIDVDKQRVKLLDALQSRDNAYAKISEHAQALQSLEVQVAKLTAERDTLLNQSLWIALTRWWSNRWAGRRTA